MKKSIASIVCAAFVLAGPGQTIVLAAGQIRAQAPAEVPTLAVPAVAVGMDMPQAAAVAAAAPLSAEAPAAAVPAAAAAAQPGAVTAAGSLETFAGAVAQPGADFYGVSNVYFDADRVGAQGYDAPVAQHELGHGIFLEPSEPSRRERAAVAADRSAVKSSGASVTGMIGMAAAIGAVAAYIGVPKVKDLVNRAVSTLLILIKLKKRQPTVQEIVEARMKELEEGQPKYTKQVTDAERAVASLQEELSQANQKLTAANAELDKSLANEETYKPKTGEKASSSYEAAQAKTQEIGRDIARLEGSVKSIQTTLTTASATLKKATDEREAFFSEREREINTFREQLSLSEQGQMDSRLAAMREKYILTGEDAQKKAKDAADGDLSKGRADQDKVSSDPRNGKVDAQDQAEKRSADDVIAQRRKALAEKAQGSATKDGGKLTGQDVRGLVAAAAMALGIFQPWYATGIILGVATASAAFASPEHQRRDGMWMAGVGVLTGGLGTLVGLASSHFGLSIAMAGVSAWFFIPAIIAVGAGIWLDYKGYHAANAEAAATTVVAKIVTPEAPAALEPVLTRQPAAKSDAPAGPSVGELADRAKQTASQAAGAAEDAVKAGATQASAASRQAADRVLTAVEQQVQKAAEAAKAASAQPGAVAPSAGQLIERLQNVALKLGDAAVTKIEQKADPNAPRTEAKPGFFSLMKRFFNAILDILNVKLSKVENRPDVLAAKLEQQMNAADAEQAKNVLAAATAYEKIFRSIERAKQENAEYQTLVDRLLEPRADGKLDAADERAAKINIADIRANETIIAQSLDNLPQAKALMDQAIETRLRVYAERAEALAQVKAGLSTVELSDVQTRIATVFEQYTTQVQDIQTKFKAAVDAAVVAGRAAQDAVNSDPRAVAAQLRQRMESESVDQEIARRRQELAQKTK